MREGFLLQKYTWWIITIHTVAAIVIHRTCMYTYTYSDWKSKTIRFSSVFYYLLFSCVFFRNNRNSTRTHDHYVIQSIFLIRWKFSIMRLKLQVVVRHAFPPIAWKPTGRCFISYCDILVITYYTFPTSKL